MRSCWRSCHILVPETASVTLVFVSIALLMTARGLRRGRRLAALTALVLLAVSFVLHVVKGFDIEEALLTGLGVLWLMMHLRAFPVRASRAATVRALVIGAGGAVAILTIAIVLTVGLAPDHPPSALRGSGQSARSAAQQFGVGRIFPLTFGGHYTRLALIALGLGLLIATLWVLLSPRDPQPLTGSAHLVERERARAVVERYGGGTLDYFALRDDKEWFFTANSVVAYAVHAGVCLVSPDPIGPSTDRAATWAEFLTYAERSGWSVAVLGTTAEWIPTYETTGLRAIYLGDEAIVDCATFTLDGHAMKSLRQAINRTKRAGLIVSFHDPRSLPEGVPERLRELATLSRQGNIERGFSMTLSRMFDPADTGLLLSVATDRDGTAQAFIQWVPARDLSGWSLDVMRRNTDPALPNGMTDFLVVETIHHISRSGGGGLGLNFAVLRDVLAPQVAKPAARLRQRTLTTATARSQVESLARFNSKYQPQWVPRYVILGSLDTFAVQGAVMAYLEGLLPTFDRFRPGADS